MRYETRRFTLTAARTLVRLSILAWRSLFKRPQPIRVPQDRLFLIDAAGVAIPFRRLTPEIDDLLFERRGEAARCCGTSRRCFGVCVIWQRERHPNAPAMFLRDHEWELRMAAGAERPLDDVDPAFASRKRGKPSVVESHDAAEATAMHDVAADVLHG